MDQQKERWLVFQEGELLVPPHEDVSSAVQGLELPFDESLINMNEHFVVNDEKGPLHVLSIDADTKVPELLQWQAVSIRTLLGALQAPLLDGSEWQNLSRFLKAFHVAQWRQASRYCGYCGARQEDAVDELARQCVRCGRREYPRIAPAVIVAITDQHNRLLLAHNSKFKNQIYALVAGFVEAGERLEDTVHREIREEVGIEVESVSYVASQPWPFPASLMLAFEAHYAGGDIRCDGREIVDARWVTPDTLPELPGPGSISRFLIDRWLSRWNARQDYTGPGPGHR
jgi:NAD+ diphosphatase